MEISVYTIFDSAASAYNSPFYMQNDGLAMRAFQDQVNADQEHNTIARHPEQFALYKLGKFNDKTATFDLLQMPQRIAMGQEMVNDTTPQYTNIDMQTIMNALQELKLNKELPVELKEVN